MEAAMDVKLPGKLVETLHPKFRRTLLRFFRELDPNVLNLYRKWKHEQEQARKKKKAR